MFVFEALRQSEVFQRKREYFVQNASMKRLSSYGRVGFIKKGAFDALSLQDVKVEDLIAFFNKNRI